MLNINIKATRTDLTEEINGYVMKKVKNLEVFLREQNKIHVELKAEPKHRTGPKYSTDITIFPKPGIYAAAVGNDFYEAIDLCIDKIKEQLLKKKDKKISLRRRSEIIDK